MTDTTEQAAQEPSLNQEASEHDELPKRTGQGSALPEPKLDMRERCKALYMDGLTQAKISELTGANYNTLACWIARGKWRKIKEDIRLFKVETAMQPVINQIKSDLTSQADAIKSKLIGELDQACANVDANLQLHNNGQGLASVLKTLAETANTIMNIGGTTTDSGNCFVQINISPSQGQPENTTSIDV